METKIYFKLEYAYYHLHVSFVMLHTALALTFTYCRGESIIIAKCFTQYITISNHNFSMYFLEYTKYQIKFVDIRKQYCVMNQYLHDDFFFWVGGGGEEKSDLSFIRIHNPAIQEMKCVARWTKIIK
jgi:hypothetical protein